MRLGIVALGSRYWPVAFAQLLRAIPDVELVVTAKELPVPVGTR